MAINLMIRLVRSVCRRGMLNRIDWLVKSLNALRNNADVGGLHQPTSRRSTASLGVDRLKKGAFQMQLITF